MISDSQFTLIVTSLSIGAKSGCWQNAKITATPAYTLPIRRPKGSPNAMFSLQMTAGTVSNRLPGGLRDPFIRPFPEHPPVKISDRSSNMRSRQIVSLSMFVTRSIRHFMCLFPHHPIARDVVNRALGKVLHMKKFRQHPSPICMPASAHARHRTNTTC